MAALAIEPNTTSHAKANRKIRARNTISIWQRPNFAARFCRHPPALLDQCYRNGRHDRLHRAPDSRLRGGRDGLGGGAAQSCWEALGPFAVGKPLRFKNAHPIKPIGRRVERRRDGGALSASQSPKSKVRSGWSDVLAQTPSGQPTRTFQDLPQPTRT